MGNICSWCFKNQDESQTNDNYSGLNNSQRSLSSSDINDRTPLLIESGKHKHSLVTPVILNGESSSMVPPYLPPPPPSSSSSIINETKTETTNETTETRMAFIVEVMLSKFIDVTSGGSGNHQTNSNTNRLNTQNDNLMKLLSKSLSSTNISTLPDAGLNNLPSLLSGRPISSDICHFVAHTAGELSRLLIDEIKIVHKEDLVVVFE